MCPAPLRSAVLLAGTGKTTIMRALLEHSGLFAVCPPLAAGDFAQGIVGDAERMINIIAERAALLPWQVCVLAIDEIDALAPDRQDKGSGGGIGNTLNVILSVVTGVKDVPNLVLLGATNLLDTMDEAFNRRMSIKAFVGVLRTEYRRQWIDRFTAPASEQQAPSVSPRLVLASDVRDQLTTLTVNFTNDYMNKLLKRLVGGQQRVDGQLCVTMAQMLADLTATCTDYKIHVGGDVITRLLDSAMHGVHDIRQQYGYIQQSCPLLWPFAKSGGAQRCTGRMRVHLQFGQGEQVAHNIAIECVRLATTPLQEKAQWAKRWRADNSAAHSFAEGMPLWDSVRCCSYRRRWVQAVAAEEVSLLLPAQVEQMQLFVKHFFPPRDAAAHSTTDMSLLRCKSFRWWLLYRLKHPAAQPPAVAVQATELAKQVAQFAHGLMSVADRQMVYPPLLDLHKQPVVAELLAAAVNIRLTMEPQLTTQTLSALPDSAWPVQLQRCVKQWLHGAMKQRCEAVQQEAEREAAAVTTPQPPTGTYCQSVAHGTAFESARFCRPLVVSTLLRFSTELDADCFLLLDLDYFHSRGRVSDEAILLDLRNTVNEARRYHSSVVVVDLDSLAEVNRSDTISSSGSGSGSSSDSSSLPSVRSGPTYDILRKSVLYTAIQLINSHPPLSDSRQHWIVALIKHPELLARFSDLSDWPTRTADGGPFPPVATVECQHCGEQFEQRQPGQCEVRSHASGSLTCKLDTQPIPFAEMKARMEDTVKHDGVCDSPAWPKDVQWHCCQLNIANKGRGCRAPQPHQSRAATPPHAAPAVA